MATFPGDWLLAAECDAADPLASFRGRFARDDRGDPEPPRKHVTPQSLLDTMLRIRARTLTNIAFPVQAAAARWPGSR